MAHDGDEAIGTKARLLAAMDDIEVIARQLIEAMSNKAQQKRLQEQQSKMEVQQDSSGDAATQNVVSMSTAQLTKLLMGKEAQVKELADIARDQYQLQSNIDSVKKSLAMADKQIACMHKNFKQAEILHATSIYHAKELLKKIDKAQSSPVGSEDLVKYAHKISASCSTVAPLNWSPGDPRRPYPQDIEMKLGWLGQCSSLPVRLDPDVAASLKPLGCTDSIDFSPITAKQQSMGAQGQQGNNLTGMQFMQPSSNAADLLASTEMKSILPDDAELMSSDSSSSESSDSSFGND